MWCQLILSLIAVTSTFIPQDTVLAQGEGSPRIDKIKDVLCMMLLNGFQKEDLDANTLEKLQRHNVNITEKNNQQLLKECMAVSENSTQVKHLVASSAVLDISTNKSDDNNSEYVTLEMRMPNNMDNTTFVILNQTTRNDKSNLLKDLHKTSESLQKNDDLDKTVTKVEGTVTNIEVNKDLQIGFVQNQPLQNMLSFWTKLTHNTKKTITKGSTTLPPHTTSLKPEAPRNTGYVHSKEMEYIGRIIAEYLASQIVPTSTEKVSSNITTTSLPITSTTEVSTTTTPFSTAADYIELTNIPLNETMENLNSILALEKIYSNVRVPEKDEKNEARNEGHERFDTTDLNINPYVNPVDKSEEIITIRIKPDEDRDDSYQEVQFNDPLEIVDSPYFEEFSTESTQTVEQGINYTVHPMELSINPLEIMSEVTTVTSQTTENKEMPFKEQSITRGNSKLLNRYKTPHSPTDEVKDNISYLENINEFPTDIIKLTVTTERPRHLKVPWQFKLSPNNTKKEDQQSNHGANNVTPKSKTLVVTDLYKTLAPAFKKHQQQLSAAEKKTLEAIKKFQGVLNKAKYVNKKDYSTDPYKAMLPSMKNKNNQIETTHHTKKANPFQGTNASTKDKISKLETNLNSSPTINKQIRKGDPFKGMMPSIKYKNSKPETLATTPSVSKQIQTTHPLKKQYFKTVERYPIKYTTITPPKSTIRSVSYITSKQTWCPIHYPGLSMLEVKSVARKKKTQSESNEEDFTEHYWDDSVKAQTLAPALIKNIAEEVKAMVLKDIRKDPKGHPAVKTTSPAGKPNQVMDKLMQMLAHFEATKENVRSTTKTPLTLAHNQKSLITKITPSLASTTFMTKPQPVVVHPVDVSPYGPNMVPIPISSGANLPKYQIKQPRPPLQSQQYNEYQPQLAPIMQTNSEEIPPLAIQVSKPLQLVSHHVIVATKGPLAKVPEYHETQNNRGIDKVNSNKEQHKVQTDVGKNHRVDVPISDFRKPENAEKIQELHHLSTSSRPGEAIVSKGLPNLSLKGNLIDNSRDSSNKGKQSYTSDSHTRSKPEVSTHVRRPTTLGMDPKRLGRYPYSRPLTHPRHPGVYEKIYGDKIRDQPRSRYEDTRFHKTLESIEGPRNRWTELEDRDRSLERAAKYVPSRQQLPISKIKRHRKYDDSKFKNFLKSQQKVTDMLEKILADNMRNNTNRYGSESGQVILP